MRDNFSIAHTFTARWEGGLTNHPADPGGLTNYGISLRWLQELARKLPRGERARAQATAQRTVKNACCEADLDMDGDVDADDIRVCTKAQAAALFRKHFWDETCCAALPLPLAVTLYDSAVNMGAPRAVRQLQETMNSVAEAQLDYWTPLAEDGRMGPKSIDLAQALAAVNLDWYTARLTLRLRATFYRNLAARRKELKVFLPGWLNRVTDLGRYLAALERENN